MSRQRFAKTLLVPRYVGPHARVAIMRRRGVWVLHKAVRVEGYTVTHEPSRHAAVIGLPFRKAARALRECAELPGNWTFTTPEAMSKRQERAGKAIRRKYVG